MTSIIQLSDIHFGVEDKEAMAALAETVECLKPDVTVICGDITQNGKKSEFYAARDWLKSLGGPKIITPGNHDTPMFGLVQRFFDPFGRYNRIIAPLSEPHYTDQYVSIMSLNTSRGWQAKMDWSLGVVDLDELDQVIDQLMASSPSTLKMIAVHHPFIYREISPLQKETERGAEALTRLSKLNIDAVLSGHVHAPFLLERQPDETEIMAIGSGTLSVRRRDKPASFNHILVGSDTLKVTEIFWENGCFACAEPRIKPIAELKSQKTV